MVFFISSVFPTEITSCYVFYEMKASDAETHVEIHTF